MIAIGFWLDHLVRIGELGMVENAETTLIVRTTNMFKQPQNLLQILFSKI
jgi:hypothetical protein